MKPDVHPLLSPLLAQVRERRATALSEREFDGDVQRIEKVWATSPLPARACGPVGRLGMYRELDAIVAWAEGDVPAFAAAFRDAIGFRCLAFRWQVFNGLSRPEGVMPVSSWETVKVAGPVVLGQWAEARAGVQALVQAAHADMERTSPEVRAQYWGKGTVDALLIGLLSPAFDVPTHYEPVRALVPAYREVLAHWRTTDEALFRQTMQAAAAFHLERCGDSTDDERYEFDWFFEQIFPLELLAIQALRRREGLPAFDTAHALVDEPWAILRDLPATAAHPLLQRTEARLRGDYPGLR